jgi:fumarate hydratase class I
MVPGQQGFGRCRGQGRRSENKSKFKMMNPSDNIVDWVLEMLPQMGAGWCPPGMLGIGIGGTAEHCMLLAKKSADGADRHGPAQGARAQNDIEALRIEIFDKVNALGIGAQGLGGLSTILDVKIHDCAVPCRGQAGGDDSQLRRHPPRALHAGRFGADLPRTAQAG